MQINQEIITPQLAEAYLSVNSVNRPVRSRHVKRLAHDIKSGNFQTTHQGIAFNSDGRLVDGQHRLSAIVEAGEPVPMIVARGVTADSAIGLQVDVGAVRSTSDVLGVSRPIADPCSFIQQVTDGVPGTKSRIAQYVSIFHDDIVFILDGKVVKRKGISSAPVVAACAIQSKMTGDDYAKQAFARLCAMDFDNMSQVEKSWIKAIHYGSVNTFRKRELFAKALALFSEKSRDNTKIYENESRTREAINFVKSQIDE